MGLYNAVICVSHEVTLQHSGKSEIHFEDNMPIEMVKKISLFPDKMQ